MVITKDIGRSIMGSTSADDIPRISFISPAKNESRNIGETVRVVTNHAWAFPVEVIVVDNESSVDMREIAQAAGARVFIKTEVTIGEVRIYGVAISASSVLVFLAV